MLQGRYTPTIATKGRERGERFSVSLKKRFCKGL
jgi:hypothetical protein